MNEEVQLAMQSLGIVGRSPLLHQAIFAAIQAAPYDVNVLVCGENGAGKEVFHKLLHNYSSRRHKKCIPVNCGALPDGTINSELFGHVKGAYTGATGDRKGFFEEADGGTIFLDEVGELPLDTQARLLRVLETGEYQRMGSNEVQRANVRVVAATNKDLLKAIEKGTFREDLYYRLSSITIKVPSLRERPEDIYLLFRKFASDISGQYRIPPISLDESGQRVLLAYQWPGNVRQLLHTVQQLSIIREERVITGEILKQYLPDFEARVAMPSSEGERHESSFGPGEKNMLYKLIFELKQQLDEVRSHLGMNKDATTNRHTTHVLPAAATTDGQMPMSHYATTEEHNTIITTAETGIDDVVESEAVVVETLEEMERKAIKMALNRNQGNKRKAAEELGISERTIHRKIQDYGL